MSSKISKTVLLMLAGVLLFSPGCSTVPSKQVSPERQQPELRSVAPEPGTDDINESAPRQTASLRLTEQARLLLEDKKPDEAIRTLEKAMNIDPCNGRNYYFLAEAWLLKGNRRQALESNRMAELYLARDAAWMIKVRRQRERLP